MKKALKWIGISLLLVVALPLVAVIAVNAFDEQLDSKMASYGEPRAPGVSDAENGYYAMLALGADDGADGMAYANAWVAEARTAAKENRMEKRAKPKRAERAVLCDSAQASCLTVVREKTDEARTQLDAYNEDLQRHEKLIAFKRYEEVLDFPQRVVTGFPSFGPVGGAHKAYLLRAALAAEAGNVDAAVDAVERDLAFQRVMLEGSRTLIGKMLAAAAYTRDLALVADLLRGRGAEMAPHASRLRDMLKPINAAALRLSPALETEFALGKNLLRNPVAYQGDDGGPASFGEQLAVRLFYKPKATTNLAYRQMLVAASATDAPAHRVVAAFRTPAQAMGELGLWDYIDNPVGNIMLRISAPNFGEYVLRLHDLDAYNRLLGLWIEIIAAGVSVEGAADFIAQSAPRFHDPYTQKPMRWDAQKKRVYFEAQGSVAKRRTDGVDNGKVFIAL
jgi:hypothetical protein